MCDTCNQFHNQKHYLIELHKNNDSWSFVNHYKVADIKLNVKNEEPMKIEQDFQEEQEIIEEVKDQPQAPEYYCLQCNKELTPTGICISFNTQIK